MIVPGWVWSELGIEPTLEAALIRRAYAARLKENPPGTDAHGFQRLRAAYEAALRVARAPHGERTLPAPPPPATPAAGAAHEPPLQSPPAATPQPAPEATARPSPPPVALATLRVSPLPRPDPAPASTPAPAATPAPAPQAHALPPPRPFDRLRELLAAPAAPEGTALVAALDAVLDSPNAYRVDGWRDAQEQLAMLLMAHLPRADPILAHAAERMGWARLEVGVRHPPSIQRLLARARDLADLAAMRARDDEQARALRVLSTALPAHRLARWCYGAWNSTLLDSFGRAVLAERPSLTEWMNADTLQWWHGYSRVPRLSRAALLVAPVVSLYALLAVLSEGRYEHTAGVVIALRAIAATAAGPALALLWLYAVRWPAWYARRLITRHPSKVVQTGWLAAGALLVWLAAPLPAHWAASVPVALLSIALLYWAHAASTTSRLKHTMAGPRYAAFMAINGCRMSLWAAWAYSALSLPQAIAIAASVAASLMGLWVLLGSWRVDLAVGTRRAILAALGTLSLATMLVMWNDTGGPDRANLYAAIVTSLVLLSRAARWSLDNAALRVYSVSQSVGLIVLTSLMQSRTGPWNGAGLEVRAFGSYLLFGVLVTSLLAMVEERKAR